MPPLSKPAVGSVGTEGVGFSSNPSLARRTDVERNFPLLGTSGIETNRVNAVQFFSARFTFVMLIGFHGFPL